jgi:D-arginine dehydrogenase
VTAPEARVDRRWPVVWSEPDGFYARPESGGLLLCACDEDVVPPAGTDARPEVRERIAEVAARCLAGFDDAPAAHFWAGLRTFCADDAFAVGPDPEVPGLWWAAGLGGHGMSASIGLGRLCAARLCGLPHDAEVARALDPARLAALGRA